jgi:hypothetical protein
MNCPFCKIEYEDSKRILKRCRNQKCHIYGVIIHFSDVALFHEAIAAAERAAYARALTDAAQACAQVASQPSSLWEEDGCWKHAAGNCVSVINALASQPAPKPDGATYTVTPAGPVTVTLPAEYYEWLEQRKANSAPTCPVCGKPMQRGSVWLCIDDGVTEIGQRISGDVPQDAIDGVMGSAG